MNASGVSKDDQLELIPSCFKQGYTNLEMLKFLKLHGITISISTVKRRLRTLGLSRRPANMPLDELKGIIKREREKEREREGESQMYRHFCNLGVALL